MKIEGETTPMTAAALDPQQILEKLKCFLHGKWNAHWWGWTVWIDTHCANTFSDVLKAGVAAALRAAFNALKGLLGGGAVAIIPALALLASAGYLYLNGGF